MSYTLAIEAAANSVFRDTHRSKFGMLSPRSFPRDFDEDATSGYLSASEASASPRTSYDDAKTIQASFSTSLSTLAPRPSSCYLLNGVPRMRYLCMDLPYEPYQDYDDGQEPFTPCDIHFQDLRGDYITVSAALSRVSSHMGCYALQRAKSCPLPSDVPSKLSVVFHFPGHKPCRREFATLDDDRPLRLNLLAFKVAMEMKTFMDLSRVVGKPLRHNGQEVQVDKLILKRLYRISRNVWQPEFRIWC